MGRRKIPREVVEYAKELYLTVDESGQRVYSFQQIAEKIDEKFDVKLTKQTIAQWADKYNWNALLTRAAQVSVVKAKENLPVKDDALKEEEILDSIIAIKRQAFETQLRFCEVAKELLEKKLRDPKAVRDSFTRLIEVGSKANKTLYELLEGVEVQENVAVQPVIIVNEIKEVKVEAKTDRD